MKYQAGAFVVLKLVIYSTKVVRYAFQMNLTPIVDIVNKFRNARRP